METDFLAELHPQIVHFPVAVLSIYAMLEITGVIVKKDFLTKCALLLLCLGVVAAFFAVLSGSQAFSAFQHWTDESKELVNEHENFATYLLWFALFTCSLRLYMVLKNKFTGFRKFIFILASVVILYLVYETAERGGELVSKFGIGTRIILPKNSLP